MKISFYATLPASVRYDKELVPLARLLYAEISAGLDFRRECILDIPYLSRLLGISTITITQYLRKLVLHGHLEKVKRDGALVYTIPSEVVYVKHEEADTATEKAAKELAQDINEIVNKWNTLFKDRLKYHVRKTGDLVGLLTERLESFTKRDILTALQNRHDYCRRSDWHTKSENIHHMTNIDLVVGSDDLLIRNLNIVLSDPDSVDLKRETIKFKTKDNDTSALQ